MTAPKPARHRTPLSFGDVVAALLLWAVWLRTVLESAAWKALAPPADPALDQLDAATARRMAEVSGQFHQLCAGKELTR